MNTPKHGSWLDLAESELGVLASQCLDRRIADKQILAREVAAWQDHRNKRHAKADWRFTTANARVKLKRLYPQFELTRATSPVLFAAGASMVTLWHRHSAYSAGPIDLKTEPLSMNARGNTRQEVAIARKQVQ